MDKVVLEYVHGSLRINCHIPLALLKIFIMNYIQHWEKMKVLSKKYSPNNYERFCNMAEFLQVSKTTLSYRMEQLGLLERNYLLKEATQRKGVA